jgi:capsid assembly protease
LKSLNLIQDQPWAIHPAKLQEINAFVEAKLSGKEIVFEAKEKAEPEGKPYAVENGVAVLPLYGVMSKRMNLFSSFSGGTSTELFKRDFRQAMDDPEVKSIVIDVDSPGGSVDGTMEAADAVFVSRGTKPIVAYANGMMASAAYWVGSAADLVFASPTANVGSIGVVATHFDYSERDAKLGVKRTEIYAGKYKRIASDAKPLSSDGKDYLQGLVDDTYALFLSAVAKNRNVKSRSDLMAMSEGRIFIGKKAKKIGLVDGVKTLSAITGKLSAARAGQSTREIFRMEMESIQELSAAYPDLVKQIEAGAVDKIDKKAIAKTEADRILGLARIQFGAEAGDKFAKIVSSGVTVEQFEAIKSLEPEPAKPKEAEVVAAKVAALEAIRESGPANPGPAAAETEADFQAVVDKIQDQRKCSRAEALVAADKKFPGLREKWIAEKRLN